MAGRHAAARLARVPAILAVTGLTAAGGICLGIGISAQESAPQPPAASSPAARATVPPPNPFHRPRPRPVPAMAPSLRRSVPTTLDVPAIGVHSSLVQLGRNSDNSVQVPPLEQKDSRAGWYRYSPTPGEIGPAILLGHVDSAKYGPAVFFRLGALRPGDEVSVHRADGSTAHFRVGKVASYPKTDFPTEEVYGPIDHAGLRLITCGGAFDSRTGSYESNVVVFATLIAPPTN
ncbi:MAG TPA: class F sortase [Mycobacteriales bacterium]|nr:class F sortase [Mycobacteriales bacterium]